jgi:ribosomal protein S18 acetylase RimI-like enzyme
MESKVRPGYSVNLIVQPAEPGDAAEILALQKLAYWSEAAIYNEFAIPPLTQTLEDMRADLTHQTCLKATIDDRIVGSVRGYLHEGTCFVGRLIVHPSFENRGIGTRLMEEIERAFSHAARFELFTGHLSERNLYLYRKLGYRAFRQERISDALTLVYLEKVGSPQVSNGKPGGSSG